MCFRYLSAKMKQMKKKLKRAPSLTDVTESQFLPILAMEAGSRSPLPLSFTAQSSFQESSIISSFRVPSQEHLNTNKEIPQKPIRKFVPTKAKIADSDESPNADKYDTVETRVDAWKTLGMQEPAETGEKPGAPAVISEPATLPLGHHYDRLQHFGSTNALNNNPDYKLVSTNRSFENLSHPDLSQTFEGYDHLNFFGQTSLTSPDYKQVTASVPVLPAKPAFNLYEEINTIEPSRLADDSHLGYACIKKDSAGRVMVEEDATEDALRVAHQFQNHQPYAIISKPKRV